MDFLCPHLLERESDSVKNPESPSPSPLLPPHNSFIQTTFMCEMESVKTYLVLLVNLTIPEEVGWDVRMSKCWSALRYTTCRVPLPWDWNRIIVLFTVSLVIVIVFFFMKLFHSFEILVNDYWCLSRASGHLRDLLVWAQGSSNILAHIGWEAQQLPGKRWMIHKYWFSFSIWPPGFPEGWQTGAKDFGGNRKEEDGGREVSDDFDVAGISGGLQSTGQWWANQKKTF